MTTVNGKDYNGNDFNASTNPYGFGAGGHKEVVSPATDPNYIELAADIIEDGTNSLQTTSTTSVSIATGSKVWTLDEAPPILAGQNLRMINQDDTTEFMTGIVTTFVSSTKVLTLNVTTAEGSGSSANWQSSLDGAKGDTGDVSIDDFQKLINVGQDSTGSANAYVLTPATAIGSYTAYHRFVFKANFANTGAATVNISALGTKNLFYGGAALTGAEIQVNSIVTIIYDGTQFNIVSVINKVLGWIKLIDIATPIDTDYIPMRSIPVGFDLQQIKSECESGTCTATVKINTTALGGTANAVAPAPPQTQSHSSANTAVADDDITVTISANASCLNMTLWALIQGDLV